MSSNASTATSTTQNIKLNNNLKLSHFNNQFKCSLCLGYIINATTINECLDSFCRSCIVKHFNDNHDCPKCGLKLNETRKWETLRMDSILQSFIYKLVPGLFRSELKLRKEFHSKSNVSPCDYYDEQKDYYQLTDKISVLLMYSKYSNDKSKKSSNGKKMIGSDKTSTTSSSSDEHRYLLCPAGFPIGSLKKFICLKYELSSCFKVDIMFDDKILDDDLQLLDIVYIYSTSQINVIKKSVNNHQLSSPTSTSLTSSSSSSTKTSTSASTVTQSSPHFHMKTTTTTTSTASTNTPNNGNAKNDVKNDNTTLKSVAVQSSSVITCATSPMNPVSSSTSTVAPTRNSPSLSSQNIDKNQLERSQLMNEREKQAMHSVSSSIKSSDTKRVIKPKVINTKLAPMVNQINLKRSTTSVLPCSTQVTTVTLNKQSKPSSDE
uniref:RING-type domain-containing protein n=1 Tax=Tetranychus urticae TaxID=32264 RepID=T1KWU9_TETUR